MDVKAETKKHPKTEPSAEPEEDKHFQCSVCIFRARYEYFGRNPPLTNKYILLEDAYVIEDPFGPPKRGRFVILGSHCVSCGRSVCKDVSCGVYYDGTYCMTCAKSRVDSFPAAVQEKINKVV